MKSRSESSESAPFEVEGFDTHQAVLISLTDASQLGKNRWEGRVAPGKIPDASPLLLTAVQVESELRRWIHESAWWLPILEVETASGDRGDEPEHDPPAPSAKEQPVSVLVSAKASPDDAEGSPSAGYYRLEWPPVGVSPLGPIVDLQAPAGAGPVALFVGNRANGRIVRIPRGTRLGARFATLVGSTSAQSLDLLVSSDPSCPAVWIDLIQRVG